MAEWLDLLLQGVPGEDGANGAAGAPGTVWRSGEGVPDNSVGINGDYYLRGNGDVFVKSAGAYAVSVNIKGPTGDDATEVALPWSPVDYMTKNPNEAVVASAGNNTTGLLFAPTKALVIAGGRFYWAHAAAASIKVSLWTTDGTAGHIRQRNVTVPVNGIGIYEAQFASAYEVLSTSINRGFFICMWETSGTRYTHCAPNSIIMPALPVIVGSVHIQNMKCYNGGDTEPTSTAGSEHYPIEPIFI